jgi:hypothetical protein
VKDLKDATVCVWDHGVYWPVAQRMAREAKRVIYHIPDGDAFEKFAKGSLGAGHEDVELHSDPLRIIDEIDGWVFPDSKVGDVGLQLLLENRGVGVWGSKTAADLESYRGLWMEVCKSLDLPMPPTHEIVGLDAAWEFFQENEGDIFWVKCSRWRGDMETWKASGLVQIRNKLDKLAMEWGPMGRKKIKLYIQEDLKTDIEGGADTYNVRGQFPEKIVLGYEKKGESYLATIKPRAKMPPLIWQPMERIAPLLGEARYVNMVSSEVRVRKDQSFWLDPCFRFPSPAGEEQLEIYTNLPQIIWSGAHGELVEPDHTYDFCGEAVISCTAEPDIWVSFEVPEEVRQWVKLYACSYDEGLVHFPPSHEPERVLGCAVGFGKTAQEVIDQLKDIEEALKDAPVKLYIEPMAALIKEIEQAQDEGIPFTDKPMPEPATVLE